MTAALDPVEHDLTDELHVARRAWTAARETSGPRARSEAQLAEAIRDWETAEAAADVLFDEPDHPEGDRFVADATRARERVEHLEDELAALDARSPRDELRALQAVLQRALETRLVRRVPVAGAALAAVRGGLEREAALLRLHADAAALHMGFDAVVHQLRHLAGQNTIDMIGGTGMLGTWQKRAGFRDLDDARERLEVRLRQLGADATAAGVGVPGDPLRRTDRVVERNRWFGDYMLPLIGELRIDLRARDAQRMLEKMRTRLEAFDEAVAAAMEETATRRVEVELALWDHAVDQADREVLDVFVPPVSLTSSPE